MSLTLITGGARSGKSRFAEELALKFGGKVLFVATATAGDAEMAERIQIHRAHRPSGWETLESSQQIARALDGKISGFQVILVDCVTLLISNILMSHLDADRELVNEAGFESNCTNEIKLLLDITRTSYARWIIVTNEVGEGIVPANRMSRVYRDVLGNMNQLIASEAGTVYLMVAGIPLRIKPAPEFVLH